MFQQQCFFCQAHNNLVTVLDKAKINVIKSVGFGEDPEPAVAELKVTNCIATVSFSVCLST